MFSAKYHGDSSIDNIEKSYIVQKTLCMKKEKNVFWYRYLLSKDEKAILLSNPTGTEIFKLRQNAIMREQAWELHKVLMAFALIICCVSFGYYFPQYLSLKNSILVSLESGICIMFLTYIFVSKYMKKDSVMNQYADEFFQIYSTLEGHNAELGFVEKMLS